MAEPNYRYRIPPCPAYDIPAMESWLEDMAAKGLHLASDGFFGLLTSFEVGEPRKERFRLEATTTKKGLFSEEYDPHDDAIQMHRQMGWVYRARRDQFHIYSTTDPEAPELNTDPQVQAITMAALTNYLRKSFLNTLSWMIFYYVLYSGDFLITGTILLGTWRVALLAALLMWDLGRQLRAVFVISRYRRQLQAGQPLPHRSDYGRRMLAYGAGKGVRGLLWIVLAVSVAARILPTMTDEVYEPLEGYTGEIPFATLEDLYPGAQIDRMDGILHSQIYTWEDPLAPVSCDFSEYAEITYEGQTFDCYMTVEYFSARYEWVARLLTKEFQTHAEGTLPEKFLDRLWNNDPVVITQIPLTGADYCVWFYKGLPDPYLLIRKGNVVMQIRYSPFSHAVELEPEALAQIFLSEIR